MLNIIILSFININIMNVVLEVWINFLRKVLENVIKNVVIKYKIYKNNI